MNLPVVCRTIRDKIVRIAQDGQEKGQPGFVPRRPKRCMAADLPQRHRTIPGLDFIQSAHGRSGLSARSRRADSALAECRRKHLLHRVVHGHRFGCRHIAALHEKVYLRFVPRKRHIPPFVAIRTRNFQAIRANRCDKFLIDDVQSDALDAIRTSEGQQRTVFADGRLVERSRPEHDGTGLLAEITPRRQFDVGRRTVEHKRGAIAKDRYAGTAKLRGQHDLCGFFRLRPIDPIHLRQCRNGKRLRHALQLNPARPPNFHSVRHRRIERGGDRIDDRRKVVRSRAAFAVDFRIPDRTRLRLVDVAGDTRVYRKLPPRRQSGNRSAAQSDQRADPRQRFNRKIEPRRIRPQNRFDR